MTDAWIFSCGTGNLGGKKQELASEEIAKFLEPLTIFFVFPHPAKPEINPRNIHQPMKSPLSFPASFPVSFPSRFPVRFPSRLKEIPVLFPDGREAAAWAAIGTPNNNSSSRKRNTCSNSNRSNSSSRRQWVPGWGTNSSHVMKYKTYVGSRFISMLHRNVTLLNEKCNLNPFRNTTCVLRRDQGET